MWFVTTREASCFEESSVLNLNLPLTQECAPRLAKEAKNSRPCWRTLNLPVEMEKLRELFR
jgi:hypothetical protein